MWEIVGQRVVAWLGKLDEAGPGWECAKRQTRLVLMVTPPRWRPVDRSDCKQVCIGLVVWSDEDLWKADIQLTEAEAAFRIHKSDLSIRPIWHQKADRVLAHILVCFLAYVLWKTLAAMCQQAGLGDEPRRVLSELSDIRLMDVVLPTKTGVDIRIRCISKPIDHQQILLDHLELHLPSKIRHTKM